MSRDTAMVALCEDCGGIDFVAVFDTEYPERALQSAAEYGRTLGEEGRSEAKGFIEFQSMKTEAVRTAAWCGCGDRP